MEVIKEIFGEGHDLTTLQMGCRGVIIFIFAFILIRISGRRSFGMHTPLDNIVSILLGAVLSRAIVGASPFLPIVMTCLVIVILHRALSFLVTQTTTFDKIVEGDKILLFTEGRFIVENMRKALVCKEDIMEGVRKSANTEDIGKIETVYMEPNGEVTVIKKQKEQ
jgi:uncharacterized membrane protein YcaP (DUF421 family)